jgi:hypothetical protein
MGHVGIDGKIILKMDHREMGCEDVDCINLARNRYQWQELVIWVMNLRVL